jgi:predicted metal-dependent phosphoesterase TrpH
LIADLHLHSTFSDGRLEPDALVDLVAGAGVELMALTDHDTLAGHEAARARARRRGLRFVGGIEMTTYAHGQVVHVLGLGCKQTDWLQKANDAARRIWDENQRRWIESLERDGVDLNWTRDFPDHPVRLPTLIERICLAGVDGGDPVAVHQRFRAFFSALAPQAYHGLASPAQAAHIIREAGGLAFLAHPLMLHDAGLAAGLLSACDGLETEYLRYTEEQRASLRQLAFASGKLSCGGSDYHGYFEPRYQPPNFVAPDELLSRLSI